MIVSCRQGLQREGLAQLIEDLPSGIVMCEIGCWQGESAEMFLLSGKVKEFHAVDIWHIAESEKAFDKRMKKFKIHKCKGTIKDAILPELDFVYIDASHSYQRVVTDVTYSLKYLKKGALIGGHDYAPRYKDRVVKAVDELVGKPDKIYIDSSWIKRL